MPTEPSCAWRRRESLFRPLSRAMTRAHGTVMLCSSLVVWLSGCEPRGPVVLGVATSVPYLDAARMAVADELAVAPVPGLDTVMLPQATNLAAPAIEVGHRLVKVKGLIAVVGHSNSAASLAAAPVYNDHEIVQIAPTASASVFSGAGPYSFRLVPPDDRQGRFLADHLQELLPAGGRVAVVYVNDDYGRGLRAALVTSLNVRQLTVVVELPHVEEEVRSAEIAYAAEALRAARPDVLVWLARGAVLARLIGPIRDVLPNMPIVGGDAVATGAIRDAPRELLGNIRFVEFVDLDATAALRTFANRYRDRFGRDPGGPEVLTYDAVRLVIAGVRAGARTGHDLRAYLVSLGRGSPPYVGLTGPVVFDDNGDVERSYVLETLKQETGR